MTKSVNITKNVIRVTIFKKLRLPHYQRLPQKITIFFVTIQNSFVKFFYNSILFYKTHFKNVIMQKVMKTRLVNNYGAYVRKKNKIIKMQHGSLYILSNE